MIKYSVGDEVSYKGERCRIMDIHQSGSIKIISITGNVYIVTGGQIKPIVRVSG